MTETPETPGAPEAPTGPPAGPSRRRHRLHCRPRQRCGPAADYPVHLDVERQEEYSRFMPLIKWLLAIPHYIALLVLGIGAFFVVIISFFAVLFTGRYPRGDVQLHGRRPPLGVEGRRVRVAHGRPVSAVHARRRPVLPGAASTSSIRSTWSAGGPLLTWLLVIPYAIVAYFVIYLGGDHGLLRLLHDPVHEAVSRRACSTSPGSGCGGRREATPTPTGWSPGTRRSSGTERLTQAERGGGPSGARLAFGGAIRPGP